MSTHRFYLAPEEWASEAPGLDASDSHHCADVLRLGPGDRVVVFDGLGKVAEAELTEVRRKRCLIRLGEPHVAPGLPCSITLVQSVPKGKNMDLILQKAVELGASAIVPLLSARTVVKVDDPADASRKRDRWQQIALEACKQCGRNAVPRVALPVTPAALFSEVSAPELILLASLQPGAVGIKEALMRAGAASGGKPPASVAVLVGPEGDFTPEEIAGFLSMGAVPITLGPMILRAETAALYSLSVLAHELF
jgi:16S rRNA (uracil1498-N3)-methyltransferase